MKTKFFAALAGLVIITACCISTANGSKPDTSSNKITPEDIVASIRAGNSDFEGLAGKVIEERSHFINALLNIFRDAGASTYQRCAAAYYLGEAHASEA